MIQYNLLDLIIYYIKIYKKQIQFKNNQNSKFKINSKF